jgi:hypothetical protein
MTISMNLIFPALEMSTMKISMKKRKLVVAGVAEASVVDNNLLVKALAY